MRQQHKENRGLITSTIREEIFRKNKDLTIAINTESFFWSSCIMVFMHPWRPDENMNKAAAAAGVIRRL